MYRFIEEGGSRLKSGEEIDGLTLAQELTRLAPSEDDKRATDRLLAESAALADEMRAYLDKISPEPPLVDREEKTDANCVPS